jgi:hypothetical protein
LQTEIVAAGGRRVGDDRAVRIALGGRARRRPTGVRHVDPVSRAMIRAALSSG